MKQPIERLVIGEAPTLLQATKGNELIDAINALGNITIKAGTKDEVIYGDDGLIVTYKFPPNGWEEKVVTLCENGSEVDFTFLVRAAL